VRYIVHIVTVDQFAALFAIRTNAVYVFLYTMGIQFKLIYV